MKVEQIFEEMQLLLENFNDMADAYQAAKASLPTIAPHIIGRERDILQNAARAELRANDIVDLYVDMVRKNIPLVTEGLDAVQNPRDAGQWVRAFRSRPRLGIADFMNCLTASIRTVVKRRDDKIGQSKYQVVGRGQGFIIFKPEHRAAACKLGSGTKWCISSNSNNYFDRYSEESDIYIIHTARRQKYAVLLDRRTKKIVEVQHSNNEYRQPDGRIIADFAARLKADGADLTGIEDALNITLTENDVSIEGFELILSSDRQIGTHRFRKFELGTTVLDNGVQEALIADVELMELTSPQNVKFYGWSGGNDESEQSISFSIFLNNDQVPAPRQLDSSEQLHYLELIRKSLREHNINQNQTVMATDDFREYMEAVLDGRL